MKGESKAQRATYTKLLRAADHDSLHELIARHGVEILDRSLPYLFVAARNQLRSRQRRERVRAHSREVDESASSIWNPWDRLVDREALRRLAEAISSLAPEDRLLLMRKAEGATYAEIIEEWDQLGFSPIHPSAETLRKRRQRLLEKLREGLGRQTSD